MAPGASPVTAEALIAASDIVILALPLSKYRELRPELLVGKIVIDVMNSWAPTDSTMNEFEHQEASSAIVQDYLPGAPRDRAGGAPTGRPQAPCNGCGRR